MSIRPLAVASVTLSLRRSICFRCAKDAGRATQHQIRTLHHSSRSLQTAAARSDGGSVNRKFFLPNAFQVREGEEVERFQTGRLPGRLNKGTSNAREVASGEDIPLKATDQAKEPPHRRRQRLKKETTLADATPDVPLPPDASSSLSETAAAAPANSIKRTFSTYLALTKPRLAFLIVLTTTASYSIYPVPALLSSVATDAPSLSTLTLLYLTTGTFLCIASANTLNMLLEPAYDARMSRTRNRPLVRGLVSKRAALLFAIATGIIGTGALWYGVNPTTAILGSANILLYAFAYTPLKRMHPINTWIGAVVGAIPPLMGWCAAASQYSTANPFDGSMKSLWTEAQELLLTEQAIGGWLIAALLFAWQFPHFFALSYGVRHEYTGAGYKMLTSSNMAMASRVSLRYSVAMFPICAGLSWYNVTDPVFMATSSVINAWMLREALRMWRCNGERGSARALFWASVWQLPIVLVLAMVQKKGLLERLWQSISGEPELEDEWDDEG